MDAFVSYPSAPLTESLVRGALGKILPGITISSNPPVRAVSGRPFLQWAAYDVLEHDWTLSRTADVLASSYVIRKALIRKNFLHRAIDVYNTKNPGSPLKDAVPATWDLELAFADELEELWADELFDLAKEMEKSPNQSWILKPGMADQGACIRIFRTKDELAKIFQELEAGFDTGDEELNDTSATASAISQLRQFIVQRYIESPILFNPFGGPGPSADGPKGHKFHLRVYCVAVGSLKVYMHSKILALFASCPYSPPGPKPQDPIDLSAHLTNTSLHSDDSKSESFVRLLDELVDLPILGGNEDASKALSSEDVGGIITQIKILLSEAFQATSANPVHFFPLPNAFELYGVDFLLSHRSTPPFYVPEHSSPFTVSLLEFNAEPAIEMTSQRLHWILEDLFEEMAETCVLPFAARRGYRRQSTANSEREGRLLECYSIELPR